MHVSTSNQPDGRDKRYLVIGLSMSLWVASACDINDVGQNETPDPPPNPLTLQLLHAADQEGGIEAIADAPRFSAVLDTLRGLNPSRTLVVSSGDNYIPGPFFTASEFIDVGGGGRGDINLLNAMGFQVSAFGNHEFDFGSAVVADLIADDSPKYSGTAFPFLSCNMDFSGSSSLSGLVVEDGQEASEVPNSIARSTVVTILRQKVGIIGATTPTLAKISSPDAGIVISPEDDTDNAALAGVIQGCVDELTNAGINKIILLAHMQNLAIEEALAPLLSDVDIIVAGGSNTILADDDDVARGLRAGDTAVKSYPIQLTSASGEPVLVVNTDGNYRYVGRLVVQFDPQGVIDLNSLDPKVNGAYATDDAGLVNAKAALELEEDLEPLASVSNIVGMISAVILERDGTILGHTNEYLNGSRQFVRTEETNLGNLTADADLEVAKLVDSQTRIAIKIGGGIRADIGVVVFPPGSTDPNDVQKLPPQANPAAGKLVGQISRLDIENALRFNNGLVLLTLTATQLKAAMEHAVAKSVGDATPGQFAQIAGMRYSFDPAQAVDSRVRSLAIYDGNTHEETVVEAGSIVGNPDRTFRVVVSSFLADCNPECGDGYPFKDVPKQAIVKTDDPAPPPAGQELFADFGTEQHALAKFLKDNFPDENSPFATPDVPATMDERIQDLSRKTTDTVIP
ncbi:MAG: bifunctional metallophosphatase/5'-nucleotidase [Proteobacteria bacterium]|nr:bifunctional metallophosphatase/5'-nucleotidase [Pseudomonadota bacterium]